MKRLANDFGGGHLFRFYCDRCSMHIKVRYRGTKGEYCSWDCLQAAENGKVNAPGDGKVKATRSDKVKLSLPPVATSPVTAPKVKTIPVEKVKTPKVKTAAVQKVKTEISDAKVKISSREQRGIRRRRAIRRIRAEIVSATGREPTIAQVQERLTPLGLWASIRTVWKELWSAKVNTKAGPLRAAPLTR